jgi:hypothetical protein
VMPIIIAGAIIHSGLLCVPVGTFKKEEGQKSWMPTSANLKAAQAGDDRNNSKKLEVKVIQKKV